MFCGIEGFSSVNLLESRMQLGEFSCRKAINSSDRAGLTELVAEKQLKVGHERFCSLIEGINCFFAIIVSYLGDGLKFSCLIAINYWVLLKLSLNAKDLTD
jgi:hypothetical protein